MSNSWRDFADQMTESTRALFEDAERRGADPAELREHAAGLLEGESFQLACSAIAAETSIEGEASIWVRPDERHDQTYRPYTVTRDVLDDSDRLGLTVEAVADVGLDGDVLGVGVWATVEAGGGLTTDQARALADSLQRAADLLDSL
ncbi:hypothetical protein [Gordonia hongkongensis]|uniref:hypothetical protein n=1 Tax=Gordonia hongkongensis TaxID=1701090 RepID=UPI003D74BC98